MHYLAENNSNSVGAHLQIGKVNTNDTGRRAFGGYASSSRDPGFRVELPYAIRKPKTSLIAKSFARFLQDFSKMHGDLR